MSSITVLLPTLNEEHSIRETIRQIRSLLPSVEICVVDGLSTDNTMAIVRNEGVRLLQCRERGKAVAVAMALKEINTDYVVMTDVDLSYPIEAVTEMMRLDNDVVVGNRVDYEWGSIQMQNEFGNRFITILANNLFENYQPDICTGLWVMRKAFYKNINITAKRFELEANLYTEASRLKMPFGVYPIIYRKRTGKSKLKMQDGVAIAWFLIKARFGL